MSLSLIGRSFCLILPCSEKEAIRRLRKTNWSLETAVNSFFDANGKEALFVSKETCDVRQLHSIFEKYKGRLWGSHVDIYYTSSISL